MDLENNTYFKKTIEMLLNKYPFKNIEKNENLEKKQEKMNENTNQTYEKRRIDLEINQGTVKDVASRLFETKQDFYVNILLEHNYEN